jgi:hypothetical protein
MDQSAVVAYRRLQSRRLLQVSSDNTRFIHALRVFQSVCLTDLAIQTHILAALADYSRLFRCFAARIHLFGRNGVGVRSVN